MDTQISSSRFSALMRQRNVLAVAVLGLILLALMQVFLIMQKSEHIILKPIAATDLSLSSDTPSPEYLEAVTRDVSTLFLNRHPNNIEYFRNSILRLAHPSTHGELEAALVATERRMNASKSATVFYPNEIYVDPQETYTEIRGTLETYLGPKRVKQEKVIFAADWRYESMRLWLLDFYPIEHTDAEASSVPIQKAEAR